MISMDYVPSVGKVRFGKYFFRDILTEETHGECRLRPIWEDSVTGSSVRKLRNMLSCFESCVIKNVVTYAPAQRSLA